jgi:phage shock protein A
MAESIFSRISRLLSGRIEDVVDQMECSGGDVVMRESIREAGRCIDEIQANIQTVAARRLQAVRQQKMIEERLVELTQKAQIAIDAGRDDLAEAALSRQIDFETESKKLDTVAEASREEEMRLEGGLISLKSRKIQMEDSLTAYEIAHKQAALGGTGPATAERHIDKKISCAEAAFDRAMTGAGGINFSRAEALTINKVAEIDGIYKTATIAERLVALKANNKAA